MLLFGDTRQDGTWTEDRNSPETPAHTAKQVSQNGRNGQDFRGNSVNSYGDPLLTRCGLLQIGLLSCLYSAEAGEGIGRAFELIREASSIGPLHLAIDPAVADVPVELHIALTLLLNLPESPGYTSRATDHAKQVAHLQADIERRFASCLSRCRDEIVKTVFSTFSYAGSVLQ